MSRPFRVLVADPPWKFRDKLPGKKRGAEKIYPCMPAWQIGRFPLPPLADDALLLLWHVAAMQQEALDVCKAWGFNVKSELIWVKTALPERLSKTAIRKILEAAGRGEPILQAPQEPRLAFGMGRYVRGAHETCIIATRGRFEVADKGVRSVFFAPRGRHSEKPDEFYAIAEQLGGKGPYCELFARHPRPGWSCYGNEMEYADPHEEHRAGMLAAAVSDAL